ncbi:aminopeptidase i zinc metalloprotease [Ligilactobacillus equi DSM 15833 = JCM 10991]|uniref:Aminopeptidase i zinc metalloprotease n=1 Tax=Ligilactobacillus equi DSM 15833 = JCM 10991 TaxID=1423740 RepID=A0A0R1T8G2_9LACO|nr:M42 family peptidase [Ligilactobacillus equi]KRL77596.1 aminopeptidase i zinc metalloprotease [Ligilactobacillus equi DSM 15833 = JCM 10991]
MEKAAQIQMLKDFSNANAIPGFEQEFVEMFVDKVKDMADVEIDGMLNVYASKKENRGNRPVIQLDAHSDAVGLMTQAVRPNGSLKFVPVGGWVKYNLPGLKVKIRNKEGQYVPGVVATKPPHFMTAAEKNSLPEIADMQIDVGSSSRQETIEDFKIDTGCPIFVDVDCDYNERTGVFFGKDFDDRFGAAVMVNLLDELKGQETNFDVVCALSSQEEVGLRGAYVTARKIKPEVAIVLESCPADDTFEPEWLSQTGMKRGPMLRDMDTTFIPNPIFQQYVCDLADQNGIPYTRSVRTGGGQDGAAIYYENGAPTIVIGIPVRYEHSAYCFASYHDYKASLDLALALIRDLNQEKLASFKLG